MMTEPELLAVADPSLKPWGAPPPGSERRSPNRPRLSAVTDVDAAGAATLNMGSPPAGLYWLVQRGAFVVPGLATETVLWIVFVGAVQDDLIEDFGEVIVGTANRLTRAIGEWSPPIYVPSQTRLIVTATTADPAGQARVSVRVIELPE